MYTYIYIYIYVDTNQQQKPLVEHWVVFFSRLQFGMAFAQGPVQCVGINITVMGMNVTFIPMFLVLAIVIFATN